METVPDDSTARYIGYKGYVGLGMLTPAKKPAGGQLRADQKISNKEINRVRAVVERAIANVKTWRILHTDYRRPYETFADTISAVIGLNFFKTAHPA